jgi:hypothetical protein
MMLYSFDTSSIMNGRRDLLPPTVFRTLWANIEIMIADGHIRAVDVVRDELTKRDDDASQWVKQQNGLFLPLEEDIQQATSSVLVEHPKLMGVGKGRNAADPFVIGLAITRSGTVVTEEKATGSPNKPKIPMSAKRSTCHALAWSDSSPNRDGASNS